MANEKCSIQDLAESLAVRNHCSRTKADTFLRKVVTLIKRRLNTDNFVKIKGLGTFKLVTVGSRESVDVNTGERIEIAEHQRVLFTPDATLKERVNKPFEKFDTVIIDDDNDLKKLEADTESDKTGEEDEPGQAEEEVAAVAEKPQDDKLPMNQREEADNEHEEVAEDIQSDEDLQVGSVYLGEITEAESAAEPAEETTKTEEEVAMQSLQLPVKKESDAKESDADAPEQEPEELGEEENDTMDGKRKTMFTILIVLGVCGLIALSYAAGYYHWFVGGETINGASRQPCAAMPAVSVKKAAVHGTVKKASANDSLKAASTAAGKEKKPTAKELSKKYEQLPGGKYLIIGTLEVHEMKATDTLLKLSKKIYGSKDYVKYIIFYNHLENPDLVPLGTKLKLPKLAHEE